MKQTAIKYKVFDGSNYLSAPFTLSDLQAGKVQFTSDCPILRFTDLHDKSGKEIYEKDLLRVKGKMSEDSKYSYDAIYAVNNMDHSGLSLRFIRLYNQDPDTIENSYPIVQSPAFKHGSLCVDFINQKYDHLAFADTFASNHMSGKSWRENWYTADIENIGNVLSTPELLQP